MKNLLSRITVDAGGCTLVFVITLSLLGFAENSHAALVAHYTFEGANETAQLEDKATGGVVADDLTLVMGNDSLPILEADPGDSRKKASNVLSLLTNNDKATAPDSVDLTMPGSFTITVWAKYGEAISTQDSFAPFINKRLDSSGGGFNRSNYWIGMDSNSSNVVRFSFDDQANATGATYVPIYNYPTDDINVEDWHHYAFVLDTVGQDAQVYVDGRIVHDETGVTELPAVDVGAEFILGLRGQSFADWNGWLDEVRLYDNPLTASEVRDIFLEDVVKAPTSLFLRVNRDSGEIMLENPIGELPQELQGYSITSESGALNASLANWKSIRGNYDITPPGGDGSVDDNDMWTILSSQIDGSSDLSEFQFGGDGGVVGPGESVVLSQGDGAWIANNIEDLKAKVVSPDGFVEDIIIVYEGNGDVAFQRSDLNTDGDITVADWAIFKVSYLATDLSSLSEAQAYILGDVDRDLDVDLYDYRSFRNDYELANGAGSFAAMLQSVPEPTSLLLLGLAVPALLLSRHRRARVVKMAMTLCVAATAFGGLAEQSHAALVAHYTFEGANETAQLQDKATGGVVADDLTLVMGNDSLPLLEADPGDGQKTASNVLSLLTNNDKATAPDSVDLTMPGSFTITVWAKYGQAINSQDSFAPFINKRLDSGGGGFFRSNYWIGMDSNSSNVVRFSFDDQANATGATYVPVYNYPTDNIDVEEWHHYGFVLDTVGQDAQVYVDGGMVFDGPITQLPAVDAGAEFILGLRGQAFADWDGWLDEVRLYDNPLTASEVREIYNLDAVPEPSSLLLLGLAVPALLWSRFHRRRAARVFMVLFAVAFSLICMAERSAADLVAHYTFEGANETEQLEDKATGGVVADDLTLVMGNDSLPILEADPGDPRKKASNVLSLLTNNDKATAPDSVDLTMPGSFTITVWAKYGEPINSQDTNAPFINKRNDDGVTGGFHRSNYWIGTDAANADVIRFSFDDEANPIYTNVSIYNHPGSEIDEENWHHYAFVLDTVGQDAQIYIDGSLVHDETGVTQLPAVDSNSEFVLGLRGQQFADWDGWLDEVRLYDNPLTAQEVLDIYETDRETPLHALINPTSGEVFLTNPGTVPIILDQYELSSSDAALLPENGNWNSLDDQDYDAIGGGEGESWDEGGAASTSLVGEAFLLGVSTLDPGEYVSIGEVFDPQAGNANNLTLVYSEPQFGIVLEATLETILLGDMDGNGALEEADVNPFVEALTNRASYTANNPGVLADVVGDFDGNGQLDLGDVAGFKAAIAALPGAAGASAAPEPSTMVLLGLAVLAGLFGARQRKRC